MSSSVDYMRESTARHGYPFEARVEFESFVGRHRTHAVRMGHLGEKSKSKLLMGAPLGANL
jgi:hypothetical protein